MAGGEGVKKWQRVRGVTMWQGVRGHNVAGSDNVAGVRRGHNVAYMHACLGQHI